MKRLGLLTLAILLSAGAYSQKKPKINKANSLRLQGELAEAKEIIDQATEYEKTKDNGKTWYYRGLIYATIDTSTVSEIAGLSDNALEIAMASFAKANELQEEGKDYYTTDALGLPVTYTQQINGYYSYYYNEAVGAYTEEDYKGAVKSFELAQKILPEDSNACINAALAAHQAELWDDAVRNYKRALATGGNSRDIIFNYFNVLNVALRDSIAAYDLIQEAKKLYPNDPDVLKNEINLLIRLDSIDGAKDNLIKAIEAEPDNINLVFTLALIYEKLEDREMAMKAYDQGLAIDPNHYESNFNRGVLLIEDANDMIRERGDLGLSKADQKRARELETKINEQLKLALPQWEKTLSVSPDDIPTIETCMYLYNELGMNAKVKEMNDKLDKLEQ